MTTITPIPQTHFDDEAIEKAANEACKNQPYGNLNQAIYYGFDQGAKYMRQILKEDLDLLQTIRQDQANMITKQHQELLQLRKELEQVKGDHYYLKNQDGMNALGDPI